MPLPDPSETPAGAPLPIPRAVTDEPATPFVPPWWTWPALIAVLVVAAACGGGLWWRKRKAPDPAQRDDRRHEVFHFGLAESDEAPPILAPAPPPLPEAAPPSATIRASLDLDFIARRAGTNLLSAAVDYRIVVRNAGAALATGIRLDIRLLSAGREQDALIAAFFAAPIAAPIVAPFDLAPDETVELGGMALHPKETLEKMEVDGVALFVPVLAINLRYDWDDERGEGSGQSAHSYVVGIDRGGAAKLQPFRLDSASRMHDSVGALEYTVSVVS